MKKLLSLFVVFSLSFCQISVASDSQETDQGNSNKLIPKIANISQRIEMQMKLFSRVILKRIVSGKSAGCC